MRQFDGVLSLKKAPQRTASPAVLRVSFGFVGCHFEVERKAAYQVKLPVIHGREQGQQLPALGKISDQSGVCCRYTEGGQVIA